jgi:hypothetical protein
MYMSDSNFNSIDEVCDEIISIYETYNSNPERMKQMYKKYLPDLTNEDVKLIVQIINQAEEAVEEGRMDYENKKYEMCRFLKIILDKPYEPIRTGGTRRRRRRTRRTRRGSRKRRGSRTRR